jgi:hypothetical protein
MEIVLIAVVVACAVLFMSFRRQPQSQIVYVVADVPQHNSGVGCLPVVIFCFLMLVFLGLIRF